MRLLVFRTVAPGRSMSFAAFNQSKPEESKSRIVLKLFLMMKLLVFLLLVGAVCAKVVQNGRTAKRETKIRSTDLDENDAPVLEQNATRKLTFIVFRHGERTLAIKYPTDPYAFNASLWPGR